MEAKDTVMNEGQIDNTLKPYWQPIKRCPTCMAKMGGSYVLSATERDREVAKAQAEISFKAGKEESTVKAELDAMERGYQSGLEAGIKEVVEWVKETLILGCKEGELGLKPPTDLVLDLYLWQTKLQEWGLNKEGQ